MVIERFTNLMFDNRSIILHGDQSSLSTYCIFPRQTLGKPYLVQFQIISSIKYDTFFVLTLKKMHNVPIFNLKWIKQFDGSTKNRSPENSKAPFFTHSRSFYSKFAIIFITIISTSIWATKLWTTATRSSTQYANHGYDIKSYHSNKGTCHPSFLQYLLAVSL